MIEDGRTPVRPLTINHEAAPQIFAPLTHLTVSNHAGLDYSPPSVH